MLSEKIGNVYSTLEEKYYSLLDFLDEKGLPVYTYNDFLEEKGLPAFPVTVALIILALALLYGMVFVGSAVNPEISFEFQDQFDDSVSGVTITVKNVSGNTLKNPEKISNGESIFLSGIPLGTELILVAEKEGFEKLEKEVKVSRQKIATTFSLERKISSIAAQMQLVDVDTGDPIRGAMATAEWKSITKTEYSDSEGKISFAGIPSNADVLISIQADGYEKLTGNYSFTDGELKEISLVGNTASFAGTTRMIVTVSDEGGQGIEGAKIIVMDRETDTSLEERTIEESEALFSIPKGTSIRLVVKKEGFLNYDSMNSQESRTMRQDEEQWSIILEKGGTRLVVTAFAGQTPLSDATVQLFDLNNNRIDYDITGFGGTTELSGLAPEEHYITAYKQGYLPAREKVNVAGTETASLVLESADNSNSSYVGISVLDSFKAMANNADLFFLEKTGGQTLPLGIPPIQTDISGYASIVAKTGTVVIVKAQKDMQDGFAEMLVEANKDNQAVIELSKPVNVIEMLVVDAEGNQATGVLSIESVAGEFLHEGEILDGKVFFDTQGNKDVVVRIETADGETFSQQVSIEGKEAVKVSLGEATAGIAPTITFTGLFDEFGQPVEGITPGKDYALEFQANWPTGAEKGGVHIRLGPEGVTFVDSQEAGIVGFEAATADYTYGKSYQPLPAPGNETADKQNTGMAGELNKFLELRFDQPANTVAFKVRVRARDSIQAEQVELSYRAWTEAGGRYFRTPLDTELGESAYSETKTPLYAATEKATINVYASDAMCEKELCANYFFVLANGLYVDTQEFSAVTEEIYALEIDLRSKEPVSLTLKIDTDKTSPKISFTGYDIDDFADQETQEALPADTGLSGQGYLDWPAGSEEMQSTGNPLGFDQTGANTSITITALGVSPERSRKARIYFKGTAEGMAEIMLQAVGQSILNETFAFSVEKDSEIQVSISPREIKVGEAFTVKAINAETGDGIENATMQIKNTQGEIVEAVAGRGSSRLGLRGEYYFKNSLDPGAYTVTVTANSYKSKELELIIARDGILTIKSPVTIDIAKEMGEKSVSLGINNSGEQEIQQLSYEIEKNSGFPAEFMVSTVLPATIAGRQDGMATIRVTVNLDEDSKDNLYGEADLTIKGMVAGNYPTSTDTRLKISYNKELDEACLYFDEENINIKLIGRAGSTVTHEIEVENNCGMALNLRAKVEEEQEDPNLVLSVSPFNIGKDETEKAKITITNNIERLYDLQSRRDYKITFETSQISKTIGLSVELWNPRTNLSYPPNVSLWMVRNAAAELAYSQSPIQIMNNGATPVTAFRSAVTPEAYMQGISVGLKPSSITATTLYPGMPLTPQRFIYAETKQTEALQKPGQGWITFTGVIGGRMYPDLGRTSLSVNYSGIKCLKVSAVDSMVFSSKESGQGTLERAIRIRNECGEQIRITGSIKPQKVSGNTFVLNPASTLNPGQEQTVKLILLKGQEANRVATLKVVGLLVRQNKWIESNELQVTLKLGELAATTEGKATQKISVKVCDSDDETKQIAFPIISSDCANGYCDAQQLAEYLTKKANALIKMAEDKIKRAKNNASNFGNCANKEYCSFDEMGILTDQFPVYQQLDFMTSEVLEKAMKEKGNSELKTYGVFQGAKRAEDIGSIGFDVGKVYLGGSFKGCGKYYVQIIGAARVINGEIPLESSERNFMASINIEQGPSVTEECLHRIENVANFLPVDKGFTILQNYHAWPGLVKSGSETNKLAEAFAKELFGKAEGRHSPSVSTTSNRLEIVKGDTGNGLLKIRIEKKGKANEPKAVYAHVPSTYTESDEQLASEIAKTFTSFENHSFSEDDCWGDDGLGQYVVMKGYSDIEKLYGKLAITGEKEIKINKETQCIGLEITSKALENVWFSTDFLAEGQNPTKTGIEFIEILDKEDNSLLKEQANGSSTKKEEIKLEKEGESYKAEFKLCIKGSEEFPLAAQNIKSVSITGHGSATVDRKTDPPHEVNISACGIHPIELVEKMAGVSAENLNEKQTRYATVGWAGRASDTVKLSELRIALAAQVAKERAKNKQYVAGEGVAAGAQQEVKTRIGNDTMTGIGMYFAGCTGATLAVKWMVPTKLISDILFNCGMPSIMAAKKAARNYGTSANEIIDAIDKYMKPLYPVAILLGAAKGGIGMGLQTTAVGLPFFLDAIGQEEEQLTVQELEEQKTEFAEQMLNSGLLGGQLAKVVNLGEKSMWIVTESNAKALAEAAASQVKLSPDLGDAGDLVMDSLKKNLEKNFKEQAKKGAVRAADVFDEVAAASTTDLASDISDEFIGKLGKTSGRFTKGFNGTDIGKEYAKASQTAAKDALSKEGISVKSFKSQAIERIGSKPIAQRPPDLDFTVSIPDRVPADFDAEAFIKQQIQGKEALGKYNAQSLRNYQDELLDAWKTNYGEALSEVQEEAYKKTMNSLDDLGVDIRRTDIKNMARKSYGLDGRTSKTAIESISEADAIQDLRAKKPIQIAVGETANKRVDVIKQTLKKAGIDEEFAKMKKFSKVSLTKEGLEETSQKIGNSLRANMGNVLKNVGLGLAGSVVAQVGGWAAWDFYWTYVADKGPGDNGMITVEGTDQQFPSDRTLLGKPIINLDELTNFTTYKIEIEKSHAGRIQFYFTEVKVDDKKAMEEMKETLNKNPEMEWKGDCKKFGQLPAPKILGTCAEALIPDEGDGIAIAMWKAYYDNEETIYTLSRNFSVPQHEIMAVLATEPTKLVPDMPQNWYLHGEEKRKGWLGQIVTRIKAKGINSVYDSMASNIVLKAKLKIWERTQCKVKIGS